MEPTDFKNVIIKDIPPALSLEWPACLLKSYRKQKLQKFYNKKLQKLDNFEILASVASKTTSKP